FLAGFDLGRVEDRSTRVCPKCGTVVSAEDVDCPMCGADLVSARMGTSQRARAGRKGAAPSEYYGNALREGVKYLGKKQSLAWKSVILFSIFGVLAMLGWLMLVWCHNWPPQMFWIFVASILTLFLPGWVWVVQNQLIRRALEPKREKYPVRMEPFIAVSLGIKAFAWSLIFGLPIWMLLGLPGLVLTKMESGTGPILLAVAAGLFLPVALVSWPVAQAHFAMPLTWPGWAIHKVLPDVGKNIGPSMHWAVFAFLTAVPIMGIATGGGFLAWKDLSTLSETLAYNADVNADKDALLYAEQEQLEATPEVTEGAKRETKDIEWMRLLWPSVAIVLTALPAGFWLVFNARTAAYFVKLFRPNIDELIAHEKEYVYVAKSADERSLETKSTESWATVFASVGVAVALGLAGGAIFATFNDDIGYLYGMGAGIAIMGGLTALGGKIAVCKIAWEESAIWAIFCFFSPFDIVLFIYSIKNWHAAKLPFVTYLLANAAVALGYVLMIMGVVSEVVAAQPPAN
ncbi:MAG: zinc ribbon domain-containing protein, partial [Planctomycetota bacterium]|nr:zinc ribbon domain-containing protein [Planctomycetota bacterium]